MGAFSSSRERSMCSGFLSSSIVEVFSDVMGSLAVAFLAVTYEWLMGDSISVVSKLYLLQGAQT